MDYRNFPLDAQLCKIRIGPVSEQVDVITYEGSLINDPANQRTLQYAVEIGMLSNKDKYFVDDWGWNYSLTGIDVRLKRYTAPFLLQFYLPSTMFVVISWISFVVPHDSGERTGMIVTLLLVVVSMYLAVVASSPKARTLTAIEVWLVACIVFLFFSLIELGIVMQVVAYYDREEKLAEKKKMRYSDFLFWRKTERESPVFVVRNASQNFNDQLQINQPDERHVASLADKRDVKGHVKLMPEESKAKKALGKRMAKRVDRIALVLFPIAFSFFVIFYTKKFTF